MAFAPKLAEFDQAGFPGIQIYGLELLRFGVVDYRINIGCGALEVIEPVLLAFVDGFGSHGVLRL
ncbi:MAG: hypothetical protein AAGF57_19700 [Pseudomonadota bacterium]